MNIEILILKLRKIFIVYMDQQELNLKEGLNVMGFEHLELAKQLMTEAFLANNQIWKSFVLNKEQMKQFFDRTLKSHLESQERSRKRFARDIAHELLYVRDGKVISTIHHFELEDYKDLQKIQQPQTLEIFKELEKEGKELIKAVDLSTYPPGTAVYANFGGTDPKEEVSSLKKSVMFLQYHLALKKSGFQKVIGRVSNIKAMAIYKKIGATVLKEATFVRDGKQFPLFFFEVDLNNEIFKQLQNSLEGLIEKQKQERQSKLEKK